MDGKMGTFLRYFGAGCLFFIALSLGFCSFGVYQGMQTANRYFAGADNYTCRQFVYDLKHPETDKFAPMVMAALAYGIVPQDAEKEHNLRMDEMEREGFEPAIRKVLALCRDHEDARVLNVYAQSLTGSLVSGTVTVVSETQQPEVK